VERVLLSCLAEAAMRISKTTWSAVLLAVAACGGLVAACAASQPGVKPDEMSASQHREAAQHERKLAQESADRYDPAAGRSSAMAPAGSAETGVVFPTSVYNPTEGWLRDADKHREHARQHEHAAATLEKFEEAECREFPESTRAACPLLGPVTQIDDVSRGVRVTFAPSVRVDAVAAHMRCHYAYARSHAFDARVTCPLYMPGIAIRQAGDHAVELTASDAARVGELRTRSREEAVFTTQAGK
jgi:hypothetical protein